MTRYFFIAFLFLNNAANCQSSENHAFYLTTGLSGGNYFGRHVNLDYIFKEKFSVEIGITHLSQKAPSTPYNYSEGLITELFNAANPIFDDSPIDKMNSGFILFGVVKPVNARKTFRLNLKIGLATTTVYEHRNWVKVDNGILEPNYTYDYYRVKNFSLVVSPAFEYTFSRHFGLAAVPFFIANDKKIAFGFSLQLMIGLLRGETLPKKVK